MKINKDNQMEKGRVPGNLIMDIAAIAVVILAIIAGVSVYNSPVNRLSRQIELGYKYLAEGQYEEAALAFEKAIAIDERNMEAYAGGMEAYANLKDEEALQDFYDKAMEIIRDSEEEVLKQNAAYSAKIYLSAEQVYNKAPDQAVKALEEGWEMTGDVAIKNKLADEYLIIADESNKSGNYEEELGIYDELLALLGKDEAVLDALEKCLDTYLELLTKEGKYDEIKALVEKYGELVSDVDFDIQADMNWVDGLYQKIIEEDADAIFALMTMPDFLERCEEYPNEFVAWSTDYCLTTSDGQTIWVVKSEDGSFLSVAYCPGGYNYGVTAGAPAVGWGDYVFDIYDDGTKEWLIKTTGYMEGSIIEMPENAIWEVYHMG